MRTWERVAGVLAGLAILGCLLACGKLQEAAQRNKTSNDLKQIGILYHSYLDAKRKPPTSVTDLMSMALQDPQAQAAATQCGPGGQYVFIWGVNINDMTAGTSRTVLAYESKVPTSGGVVLFGDASTQIVTAAEFASLPKATPGGGKK